LKFDGVLPNSILRIRNSVFENAQVPDIFRIPEGIISIGNRALAHCSAKKIVLPKTLNHIGIYCFHMCPNLECIDFNLDSKLETIRECACVNNKSLCTIIFPSKLKCIGKSAFQWCYKIKAIAFPPSL
jgi:hypothetical protein